MRNSKKIKKYLSIIFLIFILFIAGSLILDNGKRKLETALITSAEMYLNAYQLCSDCRKDTLPDKNSQLGIVNLNSQDVLQEMSFDYNAYDILLQYSIIWDNSSIHYTSFESRKVWLASCLTAPISTSEEGFLNFLCGNCRNELQNKNTCNMALIDFSTGTIYPFKTYESTFFIGDYLIHTSMSDTDRFELLITYSPKSFLNKVKDYLHSYI